ncbi:MAG: CaiB/BaiF CoA transferase family protein [Dehalococcoidia bacterium]
MKRLPLEGVRVLDATLVWAGPYATQILADWGAEVIRVESISHIPAVTRVVTNDPYDTSLDGGWWLSYPNRDPGEMPWNRLAYFNVHARNKLSMTVDLTEPEGLRIFKRLIEISDVFIENNVPQTTEKLGLTYEELRRVRGDIIVVRMPGFGLSGPYKNYRMYGNHAENLVGHAYIRGYTDDNLSDELTTFVSDALGGLNGAVAALLALRHRRRARKGQLVEVPQAEAMTCYLPEPILDYLMNRRIHSTLGNRHRSMAPHGCYPCKGQDRWVVISVSSDDEWQALVDALGNPAWSREPKFSTVLSRHKHQDELGRLISEWTCQRDPYEVMHIFQHHGVTAGPVMDDHDAYSDPHVRAREFFNSVTHADCGTNLYPGLMWKQSNHPNRIRIPPCRLGEHNEYVYKGLLGVSKGKYEHLKREGHIGTSYTSVSRPASKERGWTEYES